VNKFHNDGETGCVITIFDLGGNRHSPLKSLINIQTSDEKHMNTTPFIRFLLASFLAFVVGDDSGSLDCASLVFDPGGNPGHFQSYCLDAFNFSAVVSVFTETTQWFK
jgi:hypothetical protein